MIAAILCVALLIASFVINAKAQRLHDERKLHGAKRETYTILYIVTLGLGILMLLSIATALLERL